MYMLTLVLRHRFVDIDEYTFLNLLMCWCDLMMIYGGILLELVWKFMTEVVL